MRDFAPSNRSPAASLTDAAPPSLCPACSSKSIVTTEKRPDADTYWRCTACGEIWNVSRSQNKSPYGRQRW